MAIPAPLMFKKSAAEGTLERQLVAVDLFMTLQVAQTAEIDDKNEKQQGL